MRDKILNFEKINKILDSYLIQKKAEIDNKRKTMTNPMTALLAAFRKPSKRATLPKNDKILENIKNDITKDELVQAKGGNVFSAILSMAQNKTERIGESEVIMLNRRKRGDTLEIQEYLANVDKESFLEKLSKAWYTALFFTINDFIIALLPVVQLEFYKSGDIPINFYIICEFLNVIALMDPIINYKSNKQLFYRKLVIIKLYATIALIVLANILQFLQIPLDSTEIKVAARHPVQQDTLLHLVSRQPLQDHLDSRAAQVLERVQTHPRDDHTDRPAARRPVHPGAAAGLVLRGVRRAPLRRTRH